MVEDQTHENRRAIDTQIGQGVPDNADSAADRQYIMNYYGQKKQDQWVIEEVFRFRRDGYFLDLAASDGISNSNTLTLERDLGWNGIAVEANQSYFEKLIQNRSCKCVRACVDECERLVNFLPNGELGGIVAADTDNNAVFRQDLIREWEQKQNVVRLRTRTLASILDECGAPEVIEYLSLDIEGAETRIMRSFPFARYRFLALTVERPLPELNEILFRNGYVFVRNVEFDSFYVHETCPGLDSLAREPFVQVPAKDW